MPDAVADYLAAQNLPTDFAMSPHPELRAIPWADRPLLQIREGRAEAADIVSVQHAFAGVAETGTLMFPRAPERPTTINLLPDTAIVVLRAGRIVGPYEDAWDLLRRGARRMPRNVMLVTGPSRSADIEQTLELGAHGPRRLHVGSDRGRARGAPARVECATAESRDPPPRRRRPRRRDRGR